MTSSRSSEANLVKHDHSWRLMCSMSLRHVSRLKQQQQDEKNELSEEEEDDDEGDALDTSGRRTQFQVGDVAAVSIEAHHLSDTRVCPLSSWTAAAAVAAAMTKGRKRRTTRTAISREVSTAAPQPRA